MNKKIIVALDGNDFSKLKKIALSIKNEVYAFKIGYEFFFNFGINGYKKIKEICPNIFLDLKLHDIPNTVEQGIKAIEKLKPVFTTVHISGGDKMNQLSVKNIKRKTKILGVSVLTSLDSNQTQKYYNEKKVNKLVKKFVKFAKTNGLDGIVCSPLEINTIRKQLGSKMIIVVPGIRPGNYSKKNDDQKRTLTPLEAIKMGADYLVIGRPITSSKYPLKAIKEINKSIQ
tara:strand:+ start:239 stop:925 length:687 start_codon:yes stop_codon:yes gene_type:complete